MDKIPNQVPANNMSLFCHFALPSFPPGRGGGQACSSCITVATKLAPFPFPNRPRGPGAELQQLTATSDARLWRAAVR